MAVSWNWSWEWVAHEPANFGDNPVADWIRVLCVVMAIILVMSIGRVLVEQERRDADMPVAQIARFASLGLLTLSIAFTELAMVGTVATPRLLVNVFGLIFGAIGVGAMRVKQKAMPIREDAR